jgi:hypothetical protein
VAKNCSFERVLQSLRRMSKSRDHCSEAYGKTMAYRVLPNFNPVTSGYLLLLGG